MACLSSCSRGERCGAGVLAGSTKHSSHTHFARHSVSMPLRGRLQLIPTFVCLSIDSRLHLASPSRLRSRFASRYIPAPHHWPAPRPTDTIAMIRNNIICAAIFVAFLALGCTGKRDRTPCRARQFSRPRRLPLSSPRNIAARHALLIGNLGSTCCCRGKRPLDRACTTLIHSPVAPATGR